MSTAYSQMGKRLNQVDAMKRRYDRQFKVVFDAIRALMQPPVEPKGRIGFRAREDKRE